MADSKRIPSARQPLQDDAGLATTPWYRFWEYLGQIAAANLTPADVLLDEATNDNGISEVQRKADDALLLAWMSDA